MLRGLMRRGLRVLMWTLPLLASAQTPMLFFSDLDSGPKTGGEGGNGAYVTLYGNYLTGASVTVGGGAAIIKSAATNWMWYQKMVIQLGSAAATGNIVATTPSGTSNGLPFTVRAGNIYFVAPTGSDSAAGSFAAPWQTVKKCYTTIVAGDTCYMENGTAVSGTDQFNAAIWLGSTSGGTAGNPKALLAYPGASATCITSDVYCIRGSPFIAVNNYWVIGGFTQITAASRAISSNDGVHYWRVVGNDITCPNGSGVGACAEWDQSSQIYFYGNNVHDVGTSGSGKQYHGVYFSTDSIHIEVGWSTIRNVLGCRGLQFHSSPVSTSTGYDQYDLNVHDNVIHDIRCDGINMATIDPSKGPVTLYNNVVYRAGTGPDPIDGAADYACIYLADYTNNGSPGSGTSDVYNNTLYDCGSWGISNAAGRGAFRKGGNSANLVRLRNNAVQVLNGELYLDGVTAEFNGSNNLWYGVGNGPSVTTANVNANPLFANLSSFDFHLQSGSPAIDAGIAISGLARDISGIARPQGSGYDTGAYEFNLGSAPPPLTCDLNGDGVVNNLDVQIAVNQVLGVSACSSADLQQTGSCNVVDVQRVVNATLGQACRIGP